MLNELHIGSDMHIRSTLATS
jgi:hypothetical protein